MNSFYITFVFCSVWFDCQCVWKCDKGYKRPFRFQGPHVLSSQRGKCITNSILKERQSVSIIYHSCLHVYVKVHVFKWYCPGERDSNVHAQVVSNCDKRNARHSILTYMPLRPFKNPFSCICRRRQNTSPLPLLNCSRILSYPGEDEMFKTVRRDLAFLNFIYLTNIFTIYKN